MNQKSLFLAVALTALLVIGGVFWLMQKHPGTVNQPVVTEPTVDVSIQAETEDPIDTSDWKTYRNEEYGFEIKYPKEYILEENNEWPRFFQTTFTNTVDTRKSIDIKIDPADSKGEPSDVYLDSSVKGKMTIDGREAKVFFLQNGYCDGPNKCSSPIVAFTLRIRNRDYAISFYGFQNQITEISEDVLDVLNSFHALNGKE